MRKSTKFTAAIGGAALTVATAGVAFAYWTTTGSGSGTATAAAGGGVVILHATFADGLEPSNSVPVAYTADNANSYSTKVGTLSASVAIDTVHAAAGCLASWYTVTAVTSNTTVAEGSSGTSVGSGSLSMSDLSATDQSDCKGATITVNVASI